MTFAGYIHSPAARRAHAVKIRKAHADGRYARQPERASATWHARLRHADQFPSVAEAVVRLEKADADARELAKLERRLIALPSRIAALRQLLRELSELHETQRRIKRIAARSAELAALIAEQSQAEERVGVLQSAVEKNGPRRGFDSGSESRAYAPLPIFAPDPTACLWRADRVRPEPLILPPTVARIPDHDRPVSKGDMGSWVDVHRRRAAVDDFGFDEAGA